MVHSSGILGDLECRLWNTEFLLWALFFASTWNIVCMTLERYEKEGTSFKKSFHYASTFCLGPVDFWWCIIWISKSVYATFYTLGRGVHVIYAFLEIHLWSDSCWTFGSQHGSQAILFHIPASRQWWGMKLGLNVLSLRVWDRADTLLNGLCQLGHQREVLSFTRGLGIKWPKQILA